MLLRSVLVAVASLPMAAGCAQAQSDSANEFSLDVSRLEPDSARFALVHQGRQMGESDAHLTREGDTWIFRERTEIPAGVQATVVEFEAGPTMKRVEQRGQMGPARTVIDVMYRDGRAKGRAIVPTPAGVDTVEVDAAVPDGVIDDNLLVFIFPAMTLDAGMSFSLPVFASGQNQVADYRFDVADGESIEWMGEQIETLAVTASGPVSLTYIVSERAPHRVLRIEPPGPMTVVRMQPDE